ncbi:hypothetical protein HA402_008053 [Bradysia odoriphaga]|nr:hypothetical protein HA402_008053 [Bradysia odoriphaga]
MEISEASFIFQIPNFGKDKITVSPTAHVRYLPWTIVVHLNETDEDDTYTSISVFVQCEYMMNGNWSCDAEISINLLSSNSNIYKKSFRHSFNRRDCVTGVDPFILWDVLVAPLNGYIEDNKIVLEVTMKCDEPKCVSWNSKKHTTFVGLENKTENSYLNSLIQILYSIEPFRASINDLSIEYPIQKVIWEIRQIFHQLSVSEVPVSTDQLIKTIGCGTYNAIRTHDTEYFFNFLYKLLEKYPSTQEIRDLFEGQMSTVSKSTRKIEITKFRKFNGLKLKLCGDADINQSVHDHFASIDSHATNTVITRRVSSVNHCCRTQLTQLPSCLILHLDRQQDSTHFVIEHRKDMKFSKDIDLSDVALNVDSSTKYELHAILVRCDTFSAFVRHYSGTGWLKFDNDIVSHCTEKEAIEDNFRCVQMLVYLKCSEISKCDKDDKFCDDDKAIVNCVICMAVRKNSVIFSTVCGHIFCGSCIKKEISLRQKCPVCKSHLTEREIHPIYI